MTFGADESRKSKVPVKVGAAALTFSEACGRLFSAKKCNQL